MFASEESARALLAPNILSCFVKKSRLSARGRKEILPYVPGKCWLPVGRVRKILSPLFLGQGQLPLGVKQKSTSSNHHVK